MGQLKSIIGIGRAFLPVLYCGYLLYYFIDVGGSVQGIKDIGLGPTVIGLGAVGLLFCLPLIWKIVRMFRGPRAPKSGGGAPIKDDDDDGGAAADAIIARYMARKAIEDALPSAAAPRPAAPSGGPGKRSGVGRPSFGRKG